MTRVLHILDHSLPMHSGYTFRTRAILKSLQARGVDVRGITGARHSAQGPRTETIEGLTFHRSARQTPGIPGLQEWGEIRSLQGQHRDAHIAARDRQQKLLDEVVEECVADGNFTTEFPRDASRAITTICTGVSQWYRAGGELDPAGVARRYGEICAHAAGLPVR